MTNCVNTNTEEFKKLSTEVKINSIVLAAKVSLWQETNGLDNFPTLKELRIKEFNSVKGFFEPNPLSTLSKGTVTTSELLDSVKESAHPLSIVATHLMQYEELLKKSTSSLVDDESADAEGILGSYDPNTEAISIRESMSFKEGGTVIVHEILHALSYKELRANTTNAKRFQQLYDHTKPLFPEYDSETRQGNYGTYTVDEFMVALYTDAKFIKALQEMPAVNNLKYGNSYEEIISYLLSLLGINQTENPTLYSQAFFAAETILSDANQRLAANKEYAENIENQEILFSKKGDIKLGPISANGVSSLLDTTFQTKRFSNTVSFNQGKAIKKYNALQSNHKIQYTSKLVNANTGEHAFTYTISPGKALQQGTMPTQLNLFPETIEEENLGLTEESKTERDLDYYNGDEALYVQEEMAPEITEESELIEGKTTEEYLANEFTTEENAEIEAMQKEIDGLNSDIDLLYEYMAKLDQIKQPDAVLSTTEFGGAVTVRFTSVEQAEAYFENKIQEIEEKLLEEGDAVIVNSNTPTNVVQPHYEAYLKQKEAMLVYVTNSLKNLYNQKSKFKSNKFDAKIKEFRVLQSNLESDIFDFNDPSQEKLNLIENFFKQDVATVKTLLSNPTIDNYFLAKDLLDFMQKISDPTKEGTIKKDKFDTTVETGNVFTPYKDSKTVYPTEVLNMLESIRTQLDAAQMLVKNAGEEVLLELLQRHETKLNSLLDTSSVEEAREKLKEQLDDITAVDKYLWATGENLYKKNNILDALMRFEYEIEESKMLAIQTQIKTQIAAAETKGIAALKAMGKTYELFKNTGQYRDTLVERFSSNYNDFLKAVKKSIDSKIYEAIKNKDWLAETSLLHKKFALLNSDTEFIDISKLHEIEDGSGKYLQYQMGTSAEAAAYKADLISRIGQIEYDNIVETQRNHLDAYEQDLQSYIQYKIDQEKVSNRASLSPEAEKNIIIFEARTNPVKFSENYKATGGNMVAYSIGTQANVATAKLTYNTVIPRKTDLAGNTTGYFDPKYDIIASNPDVLALYTAIRKGVYQVEENLRGSGIFVNAGDIPSFKQTISDVILDKGWLGAMKQGLPTSMPEVLKILKAGITLKPVRSFLGKQLSGTSSEYTSDNNIEAPSEISFSNEGDNKLDLASVVKASLEFSAVHKARTLAKDKVRLYMEESANIKDKQGNSRDREMARQKSFYNKLLLNKRGKKEYASISEGLIYLDRKLTGKPFSKSRMFYKYFTSDQKKVFTQALKQWNALKIKGFDNLNEKEKEERLALENTMELMGQDYFLSTIFKAITMKLSITLNLALNIPAQILNKTVGYVSALNRDGRYWPEGSVHACASFLHKKPMMRHVSKEWAETSDILRNFVERTALVNDGSTELERSEGRLRKKLNVFYPMGLMQWAEDSNQTLSILCRATGYKIKDKNGLEYPLFTGKRFNGYIMQDGVLALDPNFDTPENREALLNMSSDSFIDWREETKETLNELNGDYSHTGATMIKDSVLTAPLMLYKTWLPKYISSRWKKNQRNVKTGKNETGFMMEAITGNTTGSAGFLLGGTAALGALTAAVPAIPLTIGIGLAIGGIGVNVARSVSSKRRLVPDTDEIIVSWQKQTRFVLETLLKTPATPINILAGRELIKGSESALGLDKTKLNEQSAILAARDVARNLQYSLTIMALHFAIQAAFGPPDEEREKKGEKGTKQRKRYLDQQERLREEHPYFNYAANTLARLFQETNSCLDPSILATTFGSKNTLEGAYDKILKALLAWSQPEEKDTFKTGPYEGLSKTDIAARKALLPATLRFFGANSWEDPFNGWRAGFESTTEEEWNTETLTNRLLRVTDFKVESQKWKDELAKKTPIATENVLESLGYKKEKEVPVAYLDRFKKLVKAETIDLIAQDNKEKDKEERVLKPRRGRFDKEQMKKPKKE